MQTNSRKSDFANLATTFECDVCEDREGFIVKQDGQEFWRHCEACFMKKKIQRLLKSSRITEKFREQYTFQRFHYQDRPEVVQVAYMIAKEYLTNFEANVTRRDNGIALLGRPGAGKTHLLGAITNGLLAKGIGVVYFPWVDGLNDLKGDWETINNKVEHLKNAEVLFIDDLFKGRKVVTDWQLEQLFEILNYRYLNFLPIMISSEKSIEQMNSIDEGIGTRIFEMCSSHYVNLKGNNLNYRTKDLAV